MLSKIVCPRTKDWSKDMQIHIEKAWVDSIMPIGHDNMDMSYLQCVDLESFRVAEAQLYHGPVLVF